MRIRKQCPLCGADVVDDPLESKTLDATEIIAAIVQAEMGASEEDLRGSSRQLRKVEARHVAAYLARLCGMSFREIGRWLGRNESTIVNSYRIAKAWRNGVSKRKWPTKPGMTTRVRRMERSVVEAVRKT